MNDAEHIRSVCSALSHKSRVEIVLALLANVSEGLRAGELAEVTGLPPSTLSHHLRELEDGGVVERQTTGRTTIVRPKLEALVQVANALTRICCSGQSIDPPCDKI